MKSDDQLTELGRRIRAARKERHISQRELAKLAGVSFTTIQRIETENRKTTTNNLAAVLRVLDLDKDGIAINIKSSNDRWNPTREKVMEGLSKVWNAFDYMEHELYADYVFDASKMLMESASIEEFKAWIGEIMLNTDNEPIEPSEIIRRIDEGGLKRFIEDKECGR